MKIKLFRLGVFCLILVILSGLFISCSSPAEDELISPSIEITDQLGRVVTLETYPQRIVSLAPSNTEILFALGLGDRVVAVTDYADYPPEVKQKPSVGSYSTPSIEQLVAFTPDLIFATSVHEGRIIPQLEEKGLTVFALDPHSIEEVLESISLIGEITGKEKEASALVAGMQGRVKAITDKTDNLAQEQRPRVFYLVWHDPVMAPGSGTFQDDLLRKAGGTNITQDLNDYKDVSLERVLEMNPEVMIAGVGHANIGDLNFQFIKTETRLRDTDARQNNRVYAIDADLTSRPGPRIVEGLERFAEFIHPELFGEAR